MLICDEFGIGRSFQQRFMSIVEHDLQKVIMINQLQQSKMEEVVQKLESSGNWKKNMRQSCKKNGLKTSLINLLTLIKAKTIGLRLSISYQNLADKAVTQWLQNQLKAFHWLLIAVSALSNLTISLFGNQQWQLIQSIFRHKETNFLKFQAKKLASSSIKTNKNWTEDQSKLLKQLMPQFKQEQGGYQWNQIARKMFQLSGQKIFRTGKHCRQRWLNHLDPSKQRGEWSAEQDLKLLTKVYSSGKKWSEFAIQLNRTEHSVKNRFNSLLIRQRKLAPDIDKQEKLIKITKKSLQESLKTQKSKLAQNQSLPQSCSSQQIMNNQNQSSQNQDYKGQSGEKIITNEQFEQRKQSQQQNEQQAVKNTTLDILQYVRQEQQIKNLVSECHPAIYSPYWPYSPNNGTPNNYINSSSPISYYLNYNNYNFSNCFARFTNQLQNFSTSKPQDNQ